MSAWDFGGAYLRSAGAIQEQAQSAQKFPLEMEIAREKLTQSRTQFPIDMAHTQATTRYNNANASIIERRQAAEVKLAEVMQGMKFADGSTPSQQTMQLAGAAMQAGDATLAQNLMLRSTQQHTQEARTAEATARQKKVETEHHLKLMDRYGNGVGGVRSQAELDAFNMQFEATAGVPAPIRQYDPAQIRAQANSVLTMRDRMRAEHQGQMENFAQQRINNSKAYQDEITKLRKKDLERKEEKDRTSAKEGGKDVGNPSKGEIEAAADLLAAEGKWKGLDKESQRTAKFNLASRARVLRKQNPGTEPSVALQQALQQQVEEGFFPFEKAKNWYNKDTLKYGAKGATPTAPIVLSARPDPSKLRKGAFYQGPGGTFMWDGAKAVPAAQARVPARATVPDEDDDDE